MVAGEGRNSVAEYWWLKPEALASIPGDDTFLLFPLPFQRFSGSNSPDHLSLPRRAPPIRLPVL